MNLKNDGKFKFNGNLIMTPDKKRNLNNFQRYQYQIDDINDMRNKNLENNLPYKSFEYDISTINSTNQDILNDVKIGKRNMELLVQELINIHSEGKSQLSNIAREIGDKITDLYRYLIDTINNQNKEKYILELELNRALKENDELREQVNLLTSEVLKLEAIIKVNDK